MHSVDEDVLTKELDKVKAKVFMGNNSAFLGSLLCTLEFEWNDSIQTADTNGVSLRWNSQWFLSLPIPTRCTVLLHELWHVAKAHMLRGTGKDPEVWNEACDHHINLDLETQGHTFHGTSPLKDPQYKGLAEEEIYNILIQQPRSNKPKFNPWGEPGDEKPDLLEPDKEQIVKLVNGISLAVQQATMLGHGNQTGNVSEIIKAYLTPKVDWEGQLFQFFKDLEHYRYTYRRPNRRHPEIYMPSRFKKEGKLKHLMYFLDCSGSINNRQLLRFNSEVKYIKDTFNPKKLTLVMFDDRITKRIEILDNEQFDEVKIHGRGGTDYRPVREEIIKEQPTAAIIFTDLECEPMEKLPTPVPIIWIACNAYESRRVNEGTLIHIKE